MAKKKNSNKCPSQKNKIRNISHQLRIIKCHLKFMDISVGDGKVKKNATHPNLFEQLNRHL